MKRTLISFASVAMLVGSSFAVANVDDNNLKNGMDTENNYKTIQLKTDDGKTAHGVLSKDEADKLKDHTPGEKVKLHINDKVGDKGVDVDKGVDLKDTTTPNGVQQPAVQY